jgi:hypothetical protein
MERKGDEYVLAYANVRIYESRHTEITLIPHPA